MNDLSAATIAAVAPVPDLGHKPKVVARDVNVHYGEKHALKSVSIDIPERSVTSFIGPSGCGKSTFLRCINRMNDTIDGCRVSGDILLDGEAIHALRGEAMRRLRGRRIAMIFQDPLTSLRTHLDLTPAAARARALALLDEVGIPAPAQRIDHYPHQFSGGMRQRVVIALALCAEPELIIADEPPPRSTSRCRRRSSPCCAGCAASTTPR